jgi:hypothetical protein
MNSLDFEHEVRALEMSMQCATSLDDLRWRWGAAGGLPGQRDTRVIAAKDAAKAKLMRAAE